MAQYNLSNEQTKILMASLLSTSSTIPSTAKNELNFELFVKPNQIFTGTEMNQLAK